MLRCVDALPRLFPQALQTQERERFLIPQRFLQQHDDLPRNGAMLLLGALALLLFNVAMEVLLSSFMMEC